MSNVLSKSRSRTRDLPGTFRIRIRVKTNARHPGPTGEVNEAGIPVVAVKALPHRGRANLELIELLARQFRTTKNRVTIVGGARSRTKTVEITGARAAPCAFVAEVVSSGR